MIYEVEFSLNLILGGAIVLIAVYLVVGLHLVQFMGICFDYMKYSASVPGDNSGSES